MSVYQCSVYKNGVHRIYNCKQRLDCSDSADTGVLG